jgi:hypothetical protein
VGKRNRKAVHRGFVRRNEKFLNSSLKHNTGAVSFGIQQFNAATDNFSDARVSEKHVDGFINLAVKFTFTCNFQQAHGVLSLKIFGPMGHLGFGEL